MIGCQDIQYVCEILLIGWITFVSGGLGFTIFFYLNRALTRRRERRRAEYLAQVFSARRRHPSNYNRNNSTSHPHLKGK